MCKDFSIVFLPWLRYNMGVLRRQGSSRPPIGTDFKEENDEKDVSICSVRRHAAHRSGWLRCGICSRPSESTPSASQEGEPAPAPSELNAAVFYYDFSGVYISNVRTSMDAKLGELGVKFTNYDAAGSRSTQNDQVDRFLDQGYDILCVNIVDRTAAAVIIDKAQTAGVPVIFFNREPVMEDLNRWERAYYVGFRAISF